MSLDPGMMQQMLAQGLQQPQQQGGMQGQISPMNAAAQLAQKALLVRALQDRSAQRANAMMPGTQQQMQHDPTMMQSPAQVLSQSQMQQLQQPLQFAGGTDPTGGAGG